MARIAGVNVPTNKRVHIALTYVHGIGLTGSKNICKKVGITEDKRINNLSEDELIKIRDIIDTDYLVEGDLRRKTSMDIKRYLDLGCLTMIFNSPCKDYFFLPAIAFAGPFLVLAFV